MLVPTSTCKPNARARRSNLHAPALPGTENPFFVYGKRSRAYIPTTINRKKLMDFRAIRQYSSRHLKLRKNFHYEETVTSRRPPCVNCDRPGPNASRGGIPAGSNGDYCRFIGTG